MTLVAKTTAFEAKTKLFHTKYSLKYSLNLRMPHKNGGVSDLSPRLALMSGIICKQIPDLKTQHIVTDSVVCLAHVSMHPYWEGLIIVLARHHHN